MIKIVSMRDEDFSYATPIIMCHVSMALCL